LLGRQLISCPLKGRPRIQEPAIAVTQPKEELTGVNVSQADVRFAIAFEVPREHLIWTARRVSCPLKGRPYIVEPTRSIAQKKEQLAATNFPQPNVTLAVAVKVPCEHLIWTARRISCPLERGHRSAKITSAIA
jgi:hypothetical protein